MQSSNLPKLSFGSSTFATLRFCNELYVDKTELIFRLARLDRKALFVRPRRFGKSLLVSTLKTLFKHGLRDFTGLAIEKLWTDTTYDVVHLDFSEVKEFSDAQAFARKFSEHIVLNFKDAGFQYSSIANAVCDLTWGLKTRPAKSLVVLVDEWDAPLTATMDRPELHKEICGIMRDFFEALNTADKALRFLFVTGITTCDSKAVLSAVENLTDISQDPEFAHLVGFTKEEIADTFAQHIESTGAILGLTEQEVIANLMRYYGGYRFSPTQLQEVACPWAVLYFFTVPQAGFENYWFGTAGNEALQSILESAGLDAPESFAPSLTGASITNAEPTDARQRLLFEAGYLTIRSRTSAGKVVLGYPNQEVEMSMARLYGSELLGGRRWYMEGVPFVAECLAQGDATNVIQQFNGAFAMMDAEHFPATNATTVLKYLQVLLMGMALLPDVAVRQTPEGHFLDVNVGTVRWVFEVRMLENEVDADSLLSAVDDANDHRDNPIRVAMVFDSHRRQFESR